MEKKNLYFGRDFLKLDNAAKVFPAQNTKTWSNVIRYSINLTEEIDPVTLEKALKGELQPEKQPEKSPTAYAKMLDKIGALISELLQSSSLAEATEIAEDKLAELTQRNQKSIALVENLKNEFNLEESDLKLMRDFCKSLGNSGVYGQEALFNMTIDELKIHLEDANEAAKKNIKLYRYIGMCLGAMIVIFLI